MPPRRHIARVHHGWIRRHVCRRLLGIFFGTLICITFAYRLFRIWYWHNKIIITQLILCDEPTGNLDAETAATVADLLIALHAKQQAIMVLVTHSEALGSRFSKRWSMSRGVLTGN